MSRYWNEQQREPNGWPIIRDTVIFALALTAVSMAGCPLYNVWRQGLIGEAELRRAEQNRKIAVQEAEAKRDAAGMLAAAEIIRAGGVAEANAIIANGLGGPEGYLRYLWIHNLETGNNQVIYIPTEAGMPVLEAGLRPALRTEATKK